MSKKECNKCHMIKPYSEFNKHQVSKDGLSYYCKGCLGEMNRQRYIRTKRSTEPWFDFD